ncbi:MAG: hypothetical protein C5B47_01490 [Verrucomicrobia bacterium]|nr:MAG: hypothetical protein C5B47_01490 [Verrucomicrobiota bacterium]
MKVCGSPPKNDPFCELPIVCIRGGTAPIGRDDDKSPITDPIVREGAELTIRGGVPLRNRAGGFSRLFFGPGFAEIVRGIKGNFISGILMRIL